MQVFPVQGHAEAGPVGKVEEAVLWQRLVGKDGAKVWHNLPNWRGQQSAAAEADGSSRGSPSALSASGERLMSSAMGQLWNANCK